MQQQIALHQRLAAEALAVMKDIAQRHKTAPAEAGYGADQEAWDKASADFHKNHNAAQALEARARDAANIEQWDEQYSRPTEQHDLAEAGEGSAPRRPTGAEVHKEAFGAFLRGDVEQMTERLRIIKNRQPVAPAKERHALVVKQDDLGGFLVPDDWRAELIRDMSVQAVFLRFARVINTTRPAVKWPSIQTPTSNAGIVASGFAGDWKVEAPTTGGTAPTVQNQPTWGNEEIQVHRWQPDVIEVSDELFADSAIDLEAVLRELIAEHFALDLDNECATTTGTGVNRPLGILSDVDATNIATVASGAAAALTYGGLVDLFTTLPAPYRQNGTFMMNSGTWGAVLKLEDTAGSNIIPPQATPGTLWGRPIAFNEFMPAVAASAEPIIFGDFRHYIVAIRADLRVQRLVERYAPNIGLLPIARAGGGAVRFQAFRAQTIST